MNRIIKSGVALATALLATTTTPASALDFGVDVHAGSMGLGAGAALQISPNINMRVGLNRYDYDIDVDDEDGLRYDADFDLNNQYAMLDLYPSQRGGFRFSLGMYLNDNEVNASATVLNDGDALIGNSDAAAGTSVNSKISFDSEAGYLGIGWGNVFSKGVFSFGMDLGLVYQGSPQADLNVTLSDSLSQTCEADSGAFGCISEDDIAAEEAELEDELSDYDAHPLIQMNFGFRF
jgi:hypothetical protein